MYGTLQKLPINVSSSGDTELVSSAAGQRISVYKIWFVTNGATSFKMKDGSTDQHPLVPLEAYATFVLDFDSEPWFTTVPGSPLKINLSDAATLSGMIYFTRK